MHRYKLTECRSKGNITFSVIVEEKWISVGLAWQGSCVQIVALQKKERNKLENHLAFVEYEEAFGCVCGIEL